MDKDIDIAGQLKCLIQDYDFNIDTLLKYLKLDNKQIKSYLIKNLILYGIRYILA